MTEMTRRDLLRLAAGAGVAAQLGPAMAMAAGAKGSKMKLGFVTYLWGQDWDLPTLITNLSKTKVLGAELRTTHAHGVEPSLDAKQRKEVKKRFDDSPVTLVGIGSNEQFDHVEPAKLAAAIEAAKGFIKLSRDTGGSGVKVKPNSFHEEVPEEQTIEQIGKALNTLGAFGADYGQEIRLEVHGGLSKLPYIKQVMDVADHKNVAVCWNCNDQDLEGEGLKHNFNLVKGRFGDTAHVRELNVGDYPYQDVMDLFVKMNYDGWILLEARTKPDDRVKALDEQREVFKTMIANAQERLTK
jgi:sugar phosphate isomerase/epimerase